MLSSNKFALALTLLAFIAIEVSAAEAMKEMKNGGALTGLPSSPGPHIEKIKALGDNQWLKLDAPAADPKWGKGRGRAWSSRMPYAPDLNVAFLFGQGVHAWVNKQNNHAMDDLFVYDINANRWVCLYPGTDINNISLKMDENGFEADQDGQPIPVVQIGHGYEQLTYDTDTRKFMFMSCSDWGSNVIPPLAERRKAWGGYKWPFQPSQCSPWMYNISTSKWELRKTTGACPVSRLGDALVYVPSMKKLFFRCGGTRELWLYDPQPNTWSKLSAKGTPPPFGIDCLACLDSKRDRIYLDGGYNPGGAKSVRAFCCFDLKSNSWIDLQPKCKICEGDDRYGTAMAAMNYDSANDAAVVCYHGTNKPLHGIYVYQADANAWSETAVPLPPGFFPSQYAGCVSSFYSPELNAHFFFVAGDSNDDGVIWAYRYKRH